MPAEGVGFQSDLRVVSLSPAPVVAAVVAMGLVEEMALIRNGMQVGNGNMLILVL